MLVAKQITFASRRITISPKSYHDWNEVAGDTRRWMTSMDSFIRFIIITYFMISSCFPPGSGSKNNSRLIVHHPPTMLTILPTHPEYHVCDDVSCVDILPTARVCSYGGCLTVVVSKPLALLLKFSCGTVFVEKNNRASLPRVW